jgi:hypothetical protein
MVSREVWSARSEGCGERRLTMPAPTRPLSRWLLRSGTAAGILVPMVLLADGATRPGYSLWHHGASQLGTGDRAWLQTANFVLGGILLSLYAMGLRRTLHPGPGATWAPILTATAGAGLILAGLIPTDPALGYPPGQPDGPTTSGRIHQLAGLAVFTGLSAAALVLARRANKLHRGWARYLRASGILVIMFAVTAGIAYRLDTLGIWQPAPAGLLEHLALLTGFGSTIAISLRLPFQRHHRERG